MPDGGQGGRSTAQRSAPLPPIAQDSTPYPTDEEKTKVSRQGPVHGEPGQSTPITPLAILETKDLPRRAQTPVETKATDSWHAMAARMGQNTRHTRGDRAEAPAGRASKDHFRQDPGATGADRDPVWESSSSTSQ